MPFDYSKLSEVIMLLIKIWNTHPLKYSSVIFNIASSLQLHEQNSHQQSFYMQVFFSSCSCFIDVANVKSFLVTL